MNLQAALAAPRFTKYAFTGCDLQMEEHFPADMRTVLTQRGHKIYPGSDFDLRRGGSYPPSSVKLRPSERRYKPYRAVYGYPLGTLPARQLPGRFALRNLTGPEA